MFHETPKSSMAQSFRADYMIKLDTTFKSHETKFHRVVWALHIKTPTWVSDNSDIMSIMCSNSGVDITGLV